MAVTSRPLLRRRDMPQKARFTQSDITRALRGAQAAGLDVAGVVIEPNGSIVVVAQGSGLIGGPNPLDRIFEREGPNPWDRVFEK